MPPPPKKSVLHRAVVKGMPPVGRLVAERDSLRRRLEESRRREAALTRKVEELTATVELQDRVSGGAPEGLGYLFIVTYGRSGSTLLQGILNSIPGYLIRGENRAALFHLYSLREHPRHREGDPDPAEAARPAEVVVRPGPVPRGRRDRRDA